MTAMSRLQKQLLIVTLGIVALGALLRGASEPISNKPALALHTSTVVATPFGPIEYREAGSGVPFPAVHGSGGGYDQGMAFAAPLAHPGFRVIATSRFGYLRRDAVTHQDGLLHLR